MSDRQKRLQEVYEHLRRWFGIHTQADFANSMKYSRNAISLALNGNEKYLTDKLFESVCKAYPDTFNLDYLLTGNGELLTKKEPETAPIDKQQDALTYAAIQVGKMMAELSTAINNVKQIEKRLEERETYLTLIESVLKERIEKLDSVFKTLIKQKNYLLPGMEPPQHFDFGSMAAEPESKKKAVK